MNNTTNKQTTNGRLLRLAGRVESHKDFDQRWHTDCAIGLAREMYEEETGLEAQGISEEDADIAEYFGLTINEVNAIYHAEYDRLNIGFERPRLLSEVTRHQAADVLRRLAARG